MNLGTSWVKLRVRRFDSLDYIYKISELQVGMYELYVLNVWIKYMRSGFRHKFDDRKFNFTLIGPLNVDPSHRKNIR